LHLASAKDDLSEVRRLIEVCKAELEPENNKGQTPLHVAASNGCLSTTKYLIEAGASIEAVDCEKKTPLELASQQGHLKVNHNEERIDDVRLG
jgi:ankyrin repeat protein